MFVRCVCLDGPFIRDPFYATIAVSQEIIGYSFYPLSNACVRRAAIRGIIFDTAAFRGIVRWCNNDSICQTGLSSAVVSQEGMENDRRGRIAPTLLDHYVDPIG